MLNTTYKKNAIGKSQVFEWFYRFKIDEISINDKPRYSRPFTTCTDKNVEKIHESPWNTDDGSLKKLRMCLDWLDQICGSQATDFSTKITTLLIHPCLCTNFLIQMCAWPPLYTTFPPETFYFPEQKRHENEAFFRHWWGEEKNNRGVVGQHRTQI